MMRIPMIKISLPSLSLSVSYLMRPRREPDNVIPIASAKVRALQVFDSSSLVISHLLPSFFCLFLSISSFLLSLHLFSSRFPYNLHPLSTHRGWKATFPFFVAFSYTLLLMIPISLH